MLLVIEPFLNLQQVNSPSKYDLYRAIMLEYLVYIKYNIFSHFFDVIEPVLQDTTIEEINNKAIAEISSSVTEHKIDMENSGLSRDSNDNSQWIGELISKVSRILGDNKQCSDTANAIVQEFGFQLNILSRVQIKPKRTTFYANMEEHNHVIHWSCSDHYFVTVYHNREGFLYQANSWDNHSLNDWIADPKRPKERYDKFKRLLKDLECLDPKKGNFPGWDGCFELNGNKNSGCGTKLEYQLFNLQK
jgi:hypothetical protein